ncbi:hypothetical protein KJ940_22935, partial [Myxococcota bacterium]|nr:hypothetical protein [Myxococcota bacterium]
MRAPLIPCCLISCQLLLLACDDQGGDAPTDAQGVDAGALDTALLDAALMDTALVDAALMDAALMDAALMDAALMDAALMDAAPDEGLAPGCAPTDAPLRLGEEVGLFCAVIHRRYALPAGARLVITPPEAARWAAWADEAPVAALDPIGPFEAPVEIHLQLTAPKGAPLILRAYTWFQARVEGDLRYEDMAYDADGFTGDRPLRPARGVEIVLERDGVVFKVTTTDEAGAWALSLRFDSRVRFNLYARARTRRGEQEVSVRDTEGLLYATAPQRLRLDGPQAIPAIALRGEGPLHGALNIADVLWEAMTAIEPFTRRAAPPLTIQWEDGLPFACGSCFTGDTILLGGQLEDPDQFDDDIILHEFGHYFVLYHSADSSPGGPHRDQIVSPRLAYAEGLAYAFAGIVRDSPHIVDNFIDDHRHIDMERVTLNGEALDALSGTTDGTILGGLREELVEGVLWDAYDPANEAWDHVELGREGMFKLWTKHFSATLPEIDLGAPGIDLVDWLNAAACEHDLTPELAEITAERRFPWSSAEVTCHKGATPLRLRADSGGIFLDERLDEARSWRGRLVDLPAPPKRPRLEAVEAACTAPPCWLGPPIKADEALILIGVGAEGRRAGSVLGEAAR